MNDSRPLAILGSARAGGNTHLALAEAFGSNVDSADLLNYAIGGYDYEGRNLQDDFLRVVDLVLPRQTIIFATPVYWYAMSGLMKVFFDRLTDLVTLEKSKGRALAGKSAWLLVTGTDELLPEGFEVPFACTSRYFDLDYKGANYHYTGDDEALRRQSEARLKEFGRRLLQDHQRLP